MKGAPPAASGPSVSETAPARGTGSREPVARPGGKPVAARAIAVTSTHTPLRVTIRGLNLETPNSRRGRSKGAAMAHDHYVKTTRSCVQLHVAACWRRRDRLTSIHCVRISPGTLDDDGLVSAWKAPLDGIAKAIGIDDRTFVIVGNREGVPVTFAQEKRGPGVYGVEIVLGRES